MHTRSIAPGTALSDPSKGERLRRWLRENGVSQAELARRAGLDRKVVSALASGRRDGNLATWRRIRQALGCSFDDILG